MRIVLPIIAFLSFSTLHAEAWNGIDPQLAAALRKRIQSCWAPPPQLKGDLTVTVTVKLTPDGTLDGTPVVAGKGGKGGTVGASAVRAIIRCAPYTDLLKYPYDRWKRLVITFDPHENF